MTCPGGWGKRLSYWRYNGKKKDRGYRYMTNLLFAVKNILVLNRLIKKVFVANPNNYFARVVFHV